MTPDWAALDRQVAAFVDDVGTPIDPGVAPLIASLWGHGVPTDASCEGHLVEEPAMQPAYEDPYFSSYGVPFVAIEADTPDPHPMDLEPEDFARDRSLLACAAAWRLANHRLHARVLALLERFYRDRRVPYAVQLHAFCTHGEWGRLAIQSIGAEVTRILPRAEQADQLLAFQQELRAFSDFLRTEPVHEEPSPKVDGAADSTITKSPSFSSPAPGAT